MLVLFSMSPECEIATKTFWIGFNDIIHNFNKAVNSKPSNASSEIKTTIKKIRNMPTKNVDSMVLLYSEKRIKLAFDYAEFIDSIKIESDEFFKTDYQLKNGRENRDNIQRKYQYLYDKHRDIDAEQKVLASYLFENYKIDYK